MFDFPQFAVIGSSVFAFLIQFAGVVWRISKAEAKISERISEVERETEISVHKLREEMLENKIEASENFMHKGAFHTMMTNMDQRFIRLEEKIDTLVKLAYHGHVKKEQS